MVAEPKRSVDKSFSIDSGQIPRPQIEAPAREEAALLLERLESLSPEAARQVLSELCASKIGLQIQNEELLRVQRELDGARARYVDLYERAPTGYCTVSDSGLILQANRCAANLLGVARATLARKPIARFIHKDDQAAFDLFCKQIVAGGRADSCELRMVTHPGAPVWVHLAATAARDADGAPVLHIVLTDIDARKQSEAAVRKSEAFNLGILDSLSAEIAVLDRDGKVVAVNQSWRGFGLNNTTGPGQSAAFISVGANYLAACRSASDSASNSAHSALDGIRAVIEGRLPNYVQEYPCHSPEHQRWFSMNVTPFGDGVVIAHMDITERKRAEEALREQKEFFLLIAENLGDFIAVLDLDGRRLYNSPSYTHFFGAERDARGSDSFAEIHPEDRDYVKQVFNETVRTGVGRRIEYRWRMVDGTIRQMESSGNVVKDGDGRVVRVVVVSRDVTERQRLEEQMRQLAFYDVLTKLPNRRLLGDRLGQTMAASTRSGCYSALMFLDLDNFKLLNDTHGHGVGDLLLIEVADRLKSCVREVDTVARFGGDEYVVMISELEVDKAASRSLAESIAEKIRTTLSEPYRLNGEQAGAGHGFVEHHCTASIGIVLFINHGASQDDIFRWADAAMYEAKQAGRNAIRFYDVKASASSPQSIEETGRVAPAP